MALRLVRSTAGGAVAVSAVAWLGEQGISRATTSASQTIIARSSSTLSALSRRIGTGENSLIRQQYHRPAFSSNASSSASKVSTESAAASKPASTPPPPPPPSSGSKSVSFMEWYEGHLEARPVPTKMVTGSILWGTGDAVAQIVPQVAFSDDDDGNSKASSSDKGITYDWMRTGRAVTFGFVFHAPTSHLHFNFLEWMTVRAGVTGLKIPIFKAFMEQFVYWSWLSNSMYHGCMGAMQGMTPSQIYDRIADVLWETQKAQWVFWIPVQLLNFQFVPVRHQLNVVLLTSIVWTALLSAWYPPEDSEKDKTKDVQSEEMQAALKS